jgi:hypothetical protein
MISGRVLGGVAFLVGFAAAVTPSCGFVDPCDCPTQGALFRAAMISYDVSSSDGDGNIVPLPFGDIEPLVRTSPTEVVIEYTAEGDRFTVVYDVED